MIAEIDALLHELIKENEPGAAVAVVKAGEVIHRRGYGLANLEWAIPIQPDTVFRLASITKQFTATAIMLLHEQGKLSLHDPLTQFLPNYPTSGHEIVVEHLLNHTSGIKSYTGIEGWFPNKIMQDLTPQAVCDGFCQQPFDFKPGTQFLYNNSGYHLLGMIIEQVSGMSYAQFIQEQIFRPLGMNHSCYLSNEPIIRLRAHGYSRSAQGFRNAPYLSMTQPYAAGALGSTLDDMVVWERAVRERCLVSAATQELMFTPITLADGKVENYGYGWGIGAYHGQRFVHHSGGIYGFATFMAQFRDEPITVIVLANRDDFDASVCAIKIARHVLGLPAIVRKPIQLTAPELDRVVGQYRINKQSVLEIVQEGDGLSIKAETNEKLLSLSATTLCLATDWEDELQFSAEKEGKFQQLTRTGPLYSFTAQRVAP